MAGNQPQLLHLLSSSEPSKIKPLKAYGNKGLEMEDNAYMRKELGKGGNERDRQRIRKTSKST